MRAAVERIGLGRRVERPPALGHALAQRGVIRKLGLEKAGPGPGQPVRIRRAAGYHRHPHALFAQNLGDALADA